MNMKTYIAPQGYVIEIELERGIAQSPDQLPDLEDGGTEEW